MADSCYSMAKTSTMFQHDNPPIKTLKKKKTEFNEKADHCPSK